MSHSLCRLAAKFPQHLLELATQFMGAILGKLNQTHARGRQGVLNRHGIKRRCLMAGLFLAKESVR